MSTEEFAEISMQPVRLSYRFTLVYRMHIEVREFVYNVQNINVSYYAIYLLRSVY